MATFTNAPTLQTTAPTPTIATPDTKNSAVEDYVTYTLGGPQENRAGPTFTDVFNVDDETAASGTDWDGGLPSGNPVNQTDVLIIGYIDNYEMEKALNEAGFGVSGSTTIKELKQKLKDFQFQEFENIGLTLNYNRAKDFLNVLDSLPAKDWDNKTLGLIKNAYNETKTAEVGAANEVSRVKTEYQAILTDARADKNNWQERALEFYKANKDNPNLTNRQKAALLELAGSATEYNKRYEETNRANDLIRQQNQNKDAISGMIGNLNATALSSVNEYIDGATQDRALRAGMMTTEFNRGGGVLGSIQSDASDIAAGAESAQAFGFTQLVANNRDAAEQAFLDLSLTQQNLALQNAGITLSDDVTANKTNILNWVNDLENTIKTAQLDAQGETIAVLAEIQRIRNEVAQGLMDQKNASRIVMGILGALTIVAAAGIAIGTAGAATPLAIGIGLGGTTMLTGSLTG